MRFYDYVHKHDLWLAAALVGAACMLNACEPKNSKKTDWDSINYQQIACAGENAQNPRCQEKDLDADSISKGRGKR